MAGNMSDAAYAHCTDRQLMMKVLQKYPNLVEHTQSWKDEHSPVSVLQDTWNALHGALPQSEVDMRAQLLLRAAATEMRPYNEQSAGSLAALHTAAAHSAFIDHTGRGNGFSGKESASDSEGSEEIQDIYNAAWPCESSQYKRKFGDLRVSISLAARKPALGDLRVSVSLAACKPNDESCITGCREQPTTRQELEQQPKVRMPHALYPVLLPPPPSLPPSSRHGHLRNSHDRKHKARSNTRFHRYFL